MKLKTSMRGYGSTHQRTRKQLAPAVVAGGVRCGKGATCKFAEMVNGCLVGGLIEPGESWDLGHTADRRGYTGPEHRACNRATSKPLRRHSRRWRSQMVTPADAATLALSDFESATTGIVSGPAEASVTV